METAVETTVETAVEAVETAVDAVGLTMRRFFWCTRKEILLFFLPESLLCGYAAG